MRGGWDSEGVFPECGEEGGAESCRVSEKESCVGCVGKCGFSEGACVCVCLVGIKLAVCLVGM